MMSRAAILLAVLLLSAGPAAAHRPYAVEQGEVKGPRGETLITEKLYGDGIIGPDPVSFQVRTPAGAVLAHTKVGQHVAVYCPSLERCLAYPHDSLFGFGRPWRLASRDLDYAKAPEADLTLEERHPGVIIGFSDPYERKTALAFAPEPSWLWLAAGPFIILRDLKALLLIIALLTVLPFALKAGQLRFGGNKAVRGLFWVLRGLCGAAAVLLLLLLFFGVVPWLYCLVAWAGARALGRRSFSPRWLIRGEDITSPVAARLIEALNAELKALYPEPGSTHFRLDPEEVAPGRGAFLVASLGAEPLGCGAVRLLGAEKAELKRMYVDPRARGHGLGEALLSRLEAEARALGAKRLVLETGVRQTAARGLYSKAGYKEIPAWGEYAGCSISLCMEKDLACTSS